jgi:hypothetical protein
MGNAAQSRSLARGAESDFGRPNRNESRDRRDQRAVAESARAQVAGSTVSKVPSVRLGGLIQFAEPAKLLHDLVEDPARERLQCPYETPVVDRAALIHHHFAILTVAGDAPREHDAKQVLTGQPGRTGQYPGGGMTSVIEKIGLDDENGTHLARLRTDAGIQIGEVEDSAPSLHGSESPSPAR